MRRYLLHEALSSWEPDIMWHVMTISFLAGMSTPVGGWIVLHLKNLSTQLLALFLGIATGIMVTVILTDLMPASITAGGHDSFLRGAAIGWIFMWILSQALRRLMKGKGHTGSQGSFLQMGWFVAIAISLHDLPEGFAIGAGDAMHHQLGLLIALAIALHNIPEGMSIAAPLRLAGVPRWKVFWITVCIGLVTPLGTVFSLWLFAVSNTFIGLSLGIASGAMAFVVAEDIFPEAWNLDKAYTIFGTMTGAMTMVIVSIIHA